MTHSTRSRTEQTGRGWRTAFFALLAVTAASVLMATQPATPQPTRLAPAGGVTWVPDSDTEPTKGRLLGITADGRLIESERSFHLRNDSWREWKPARQDK